MSRVGNEDADGISSGKEGWTGPWEFGSLLIVSETAVERSPSGTGLFSASASATANADAVGKRAVGSLARLRMMTIVRAGGRLGLMTLGNVGVAWRCCMRTAAAFSP